RRRERVDGTIFMPCVFCPSRYLQAGRTIKEALNQSQGHVHARGYSRRGKICSILNPSRLPHPGHLRSLRNYPVERPFIRGSLPSVENAGSSQQRASGANARNKSRLAGQPQQEPKKMLIL